MVFWNAAPRMPMGRVPTMTNQPIRAFGSLRRSGRNRETLQAPMMFAMSRQK